MLFNLQTWEKETYVGNMEAKCNPTTKKLYYLLDCTPSKIIYKFKRIKTDTIEFNIKLADGIIKLSAANEDKTAEYELDIKTTEKVELLYEKISDAIYKKNCDVSYKYLLSDAEIILTIEIRARYNHETLKYTLARKPYNEIELLKKQVEFLRKKLENLS